MKIFNANTAVFGTHDDNTLEQMREVSKHAVYTALMADGHLGYEMPIGGVAAYDNHVSVTGVGFDIACGNCAIRTDLNDHVMQQYYRELADSINNDFAFGVGGVNMHFAAPVNHPIFEDGRWDIVPGKHRGALKDKARKQLGTIGSGNHYVDVFTDEDGFVWVGVHFGSRGFGHTIASNFLALSQGEEWGTRVKEAPSLLDMDSLLGSSYWEMMQLCGEYAYAGRHWVASQVVRFLGGNAVETVHNNHNFAWEEEHLGEKLVVVRKGATPAWPGQRGFIGGSMGDDAVIVEGATPRKATAERNLQISALFSTVHGAGRVMSRTQAAGKINRKTGKQKSPGLISQDMLHAWMKGGAILRGGGLDEAPQAYRRLPDVLAAQGGTINVLHTLTPRIVVMAGRGR